MSHISAFLFSYLSLASAAQPLLYTLFPLALPCSGRSWFLMPTLPLPLAFCSHSLDGPPYFTPSSCPMFLAASQLSYFTTTPVQCVAHVPGVSSASLILALPVPHSPLGPLLSPSTTLDLFGFCPARQLSCFFCLASSFPPVLLLCLPSLDQTREWASLGGHAGGTPHR